VFSLTGPQRDCLAALAVCRASWPTFRAAIRAALCRMGLVTAAERPALTEAGAHAAQLARCLVQAEAGKGGGQKARGGAGAAPATFDALPHAEKHSAGLAHVPAKASPVSGSDSTATGRTTEGAGCLAAGIPSEACAVS